MVLKNRACLCNHNSVGSGKNRISCLNVDLLILAIYLQYSLDQAQLSISRGSRIVAAPPDVLNETIREGRLLLSGRKMNKIA